MLACLTSTCQKCQGVHDCHSPPYAGGAALHRPWLPKIGAVQNKWKLFPGTCALITSRIYQCIWFESGTLPKRCWKQKLNPKGLSCKQGRQNTEDGAPTHCFGGANPSPAQLLTLRQKPTAVWASKVDVGERGQHGTQCTHRTDVLKTMSHNQIRENKGICKGAGGPASRKVPEALPQRKFRQAST